MSRIDQQGLSVGVSQGLRTQRSAPAKRLRNRLMVDLAQTMAPAVLVTMGIGGALLTPQIAHAYTVPGVGQSVLNPATGNNETVTEIAGPASVVTDAGHVILLAQAVGDRFTMQGDGTSVTYEVTNVTTTDVGGTQRVTSVEIKQVGSDNTPGGTAQTLDVVADLAADGAAGGSSSNVTYSGSSGVVNLVGKGKNGGDGRTGAIFVPASAGGSGGTGPLVTADVSGTRQITTGSGTAGIYVASIGGDGGDGGSSYANLAGGGKKGGSAGAGGTVNVTVGPQVQVSTSGNKVHGIFVQSAAGEAGDGGGSYATTGGGGSGGDASQGGAASLTTSATVTTNGDDAIGVFVQSTGGAGGDGGDSYLSVSNGGGGSYGGNGGSVSLTQNGVVNTSGARALGVLAQSIGGPGGAGGSTGSLFSTVGGTGGGGGDGGRVTVSHGGAITTTGVDAIGLLAQSVGGGGGSGGGAYAAGVFGSAAVGGTGGAGGDGGSVTLTFTPRTIDTDLGQQTVNPVVTTTGDRALGVVAQSIGGGGGTGGRAVAGTVGLGVGVAYAVGGGGGGGGNGGAVTMNGDVTVKTTGKNANGILAQSVGGGGGAGGLAVAVNATVLGAGVSVGIGGTGGDGGNGGTVTTNAGGYIETEGQFSDGFTAQSIGGGGGTGGSSVAITASAGIAAVGVSAGFGGSGGLGGTGGVVDATFDGAIVTKGDDAQGAVIQSVGGGGGSGGFNVSGTATVALAGSVGVSMGMGGTGGGGGSGGAVTGSVGSVKTTGDRSTAVTIQSVGGGGGSGGFNVSTSISGALVGSVPVSVGLGGSGGGGGAGDNVVGSVGGDVATSGDQSSGVVIQSVGGGGGSGGFNVSGSMAISQGGSVAVAVGLGGSGGGGGRAGTANGTIDGLVTTSGDQSAGAIVQSIGGGGGNGGFNVSGTAGLSAIGGGAISVGLGGSGGVAGVGQNATMVRNGFTATKGANSAAVLVQSVGGGGGSGGFNVSGALAASGSGSAAVSVGIGGMGAAGASAGNAKLTLTGEQVTDTNDPTKTYLIAAKTEGAQSDAITVQSIGGGGGSGGFNVSGTLAASGGVASGSVGVGIGGFGGGGGSAGTADATVTGNVATLGDSSRGILVQSLGGGGGSGGFNVTGNLNASGGGSGTVGVGIGGFGGDGGGASKASLHSTGDVFTAGDSSDAVVVQSIGGGGGAGGFNVTGNIAVGNTGTGAVGVGFGGFGGNASAGNQAVANIIGNVETQGDFSRGVLVQSLGGGGGSGGFNVTGNLVAGGGSSAAIGVGVGGFGGGGGAGDLAQLTLKGKTTTFGDDSDAVTVQSIGGGGGAGGFNVTGGIASGGGAAGSINVGIGGFGGDASAAGKAIADITGDVWTQGDRSRGVLVQSVGGGGGSGGFSVAGGIAGAGGGAGAVSVALGGFGGEGGAGALAKLTMKGDTTTFGANSDGIIVQSLGGGGGSGGFAISGGVAGAGLGAGTVTVGMGGFGGEASDADQAIADITGNIETQGDFSRGVLVQSAGGGGGSGGFAISGGVAGAGKGSGSVTVGMGGFGAGGGDGDLANLTLKGDTLTLGDFSDGITVQSLGGGGGAGGFAVTGAIGGAGIGSGSTAVGIGGFGAGGGDGGNAIAAITGDVVTKGKQSRGVLVQSVGGGGGSGGFAVSGAIAGAGTGSGTLAVGIGGFGADGGIAQRAQLTLTGDTITLGELSDAITVQSIGGGGGAGGFAIGAGIAGSGTASGAGGIGIGGFGGGGGKAGDAVASITGDVLAGDVASRSFVKTEGKQSRGILVQSAGGGGGSGGFAVGGSVSGSGTGSGAGGVGIGGFGGGAGDGALAQLTFNGDVITKGDLSDAVTVQSLGGGGGAGGFAIGGGIAGAGTGAGAGGVGIGGFGAGGGDAGDAIATITGNSSSDDERTAALIWTEGEQSRGILVQSLGGGGGSGGFAVGGGIAGGGTGAGAGGVGIGGFGDGGGAGGLAQLTFTGDAVTKGKMSDAVTVQSLGGGGGAGGFAVGVGIAGAGTGAGAGGVGIGGFGGGGGNAGDAIATITGDVWTEGEQSRGILVQSAGGGGGSGGFAVGGGIAGAGTGAGAGGIGIGGFGAGGGAGALAQLTFTGDAVTLGDLSDAVTVQSLGGGGGAGGFAVGLGIAGGGTGAGAGGVGIGGFGGGGGDGAKAIATITGNVATAGDQSRGVLVQSVGGGGGSGGFAVGGAVSGAGTGSGAGGIGIGGFGAGGGSGGEATLTLVGDVATLGIFSDAVSVQSIGGGGGAGGFAIGGAASGANEGSGAAGIGIGGFGAGGGNGGNVLASVTGTVTSDGDFSAGVQAQSIGGGGGAGGFAVAGSLSVSAQYGGSAAFGLGGFGGGGGNAGTVTLTRAGDTRTSGEGSTAVLAQSLGGGGGNGGFAVAGTASLGVKGNGALSAGIGGFGGDGGNASTVKADVTGIVRTEGLSSTGVLAQSLGGGGGNGGMSISGALSLSDELSGAVAIGLGGFGGGGGNADDVTLTRTGDTVTVLGGSDGVAAQSIGGGGGNGGMNVSAGIAVSTQSNAGSVSIGMGGFGGKGGNAGDVDLALTGNVMTGAGAVKTARGENMPGFALGADIGGNALVAQSLGGGGGNGGLNVTAGIAVTNVNQNKSINVALGLGGFGGEGGDAGSVKASSIGADGSQGVLIANGDNHVAFLAQSVGGSGGSGGINVSGGIAVTGNLTMGVGGFGGEGGKAGAVDVTVRSDVYAAGANSAGIAAQSLGGGGGVGGINVSGGITLAKEANLPNLTLGVGGMGGDGNTAGNVTVDQSGYIGVEGGSTIGLLAQSVGGGGGMGGINVTGAGSGSKQKTGMTVAIGVGGSGGTGGDAGSVDVRSLGAIEVNLNTPDALLHPEHEDAGAVASALAMLGLKSLPSPTSATAGILAQSIGGGGGTGGFNSTLAVAPLGSAANLAIGGSGGAAGDASTVTVVRGYDPDGERNASFIHTKGDNASGLVAQSIGGGGGMAGATLNFILTSTTEEGDKEPLAAAIVVGGDGGASGIGDDVLVRHAGDIWTEGDHSDAITAQSIGGGGGSANYSVSLGRAKKSSLLSLAVGGKPADGSSAGDVTVEHSGQLITEGADSVGIRAQSIGGSGGDTKATMVVVISSKNSLGVTLGARGGNGGTGGDVLVEADGLIATKGQGATAILAQSIGGGGGTSSSTSISASTAELDSKGEVANSKGFSMALGMEGGEGATSGSVTVKNTARIATEGTNARGIVAQSIGGGGGTGGGATSTAIFTGTKVGLALGGLGGVGAASDKVDVTNAGLITTLGSDAEGILAQSIGGGGGIGGMVNIIGLGATKFENSEAKNTFNLGVGGSGGVGATAGAVAVNNSGQIYTEGDRSYGIRAESIGGGGGSGGAVNNINIQWIDTNSTSVDINVGGSGGVGGTGGAVDVINSGKIFTAGAEAAGIVATSIGGGGGSGGMILDILMSNTGKKETQAYTLNVGGIGGTGGTGGDVTVTNTAAGTITTLGDKAYGILAQSIGGGGGRGSSITSLDMVNAGEGSVIAGLSLGGAGGSGNAAGDVTVTNAGTITTVGEYAHGIFAQSIGGGGGTGGMVIAGTLGVTPDLVKTQHTFAIGGAGGTGADAGAVIVNNSGTIVTYGKGADGIRAQSVGGGGGDANVGISLGTSVSGLAGNAFSAALGAVLGGSGGLGGPVTVNQTGKITVYGENAQAISASSINGGGGSFTFDLEGITDLAGTPLDPSGTLRSTVMAKLGGNATSDTSAAAVTINSVGDQVVVGAGGAGSAAQSVGGGGGTAYLNLKFAPTVEAGAASPAAMSRMVLAADVAPAAAVAAPAILASDVVVALGAVDSTNVNGGDQTLVKDGSITTVGNDTPGQIVQSIGGGGGREAIALDVSEASPGALVATLGAVNTSNANGGVITTTQTGAIHTVGDVAPGVLLQSIGGGGGSVGVHLTAGGPLGAIADLTLGADGGTGLNGGAVTGTYSGGIRTEGNNSTGLIAQSIGAGGGDVRLSGLGANAITLGATNGATGNGGAVTITNTGDIVTLGTSSHGVLLQSIGGGGGAVFGADLGGVVMSDGGIGDGGAIRFNQTGNITVMGDQSYGVIAQSIGGGGGWVDGQFAGTAGGQGAGGTIDLNLGGSVIATGRDSTAVLAQSLGEHGSNMTVIVDGDVRGGSGTGSGITLDGGADNVIVSNGTLSSVSQLAVVGTTGNDTVVNHGDLYGNIRLGGGNNRLLNRQDGVFMAATDIQLRTDPAATGLFQNEGVLLMGLSAPQRPIDLAAGETYANFDGAGDPRANLLYGARVVTRTALDGDFVQTKMGHMVYDVAFGPYATDTIQATGDISVDGKLDVTLAWLENAKPYLLIGTDAGRTVTDNGLEPTDTLAMDYRILTTTRGIELAFTSHFDQLFLTPNGQAIGQHMNSALLAGDSGGIGQLMGWLGNLQSGQEQLYGHLMTQVSPEAYVTAAKVHYLGADRFRRQMVDAGTQGDGQWKLWGNFDIDGFRQDSKSDQYGGKANSILMTLGASGDIDESLRLIGAAGYRRITSFSVSDGTPVRGDGDAFHLGMGLAWHPRSDVELTASASAGWQRLDTTRQTDIFGPAEARANPKASDVQLALGANYTYQFGAGFLKPSLDFVGTALHQSGFAEKGLAGLGMKADSQTRWLWTLTPKVAVGTTLANSDGLKADVRFNAGAVFQLNDTLSMPYRFIGANYASDPAMLSLGLNKTALLAGGEVVVTSHDRISLSAGLTYLGGRQDRSLTGNARISFKF